VDRWIVKLDLGKIMPWCGLDWSDNSRQTERSFEYGKMKLRVPKNAWKLLSGYKVATS
jgi:hypothetical protein